MSTPFLVSYALLWVLVVFQTLLVIGLVKALYERRDAGEAPTATESSEMAGKPLPAFEVEDVLGNRIASTALTKRDTALLFVSPDCTSCAVTLQELQALVGRMEGEVVVFCLSAADRCASLAHRYELSVPVVCDSERRIADMLHVSATPTAVLITAGGRIESYGHPMSAEDLETQIREREAADRLELVKVGE